MEPRLCIIGAGNLSTKRIYPYIGAAGARLVGVCDLDAERAARNARLWGGRSYTDIDVMLDAEAPDAVIVCIGPEQHAAIATHVLGRGLPVYTEKPPAVSAAAALAVARAAAAADQLCVTAFKKRYAACYNRAREWLDGFPLEQRQAISIVRGSGRYSNDSPRREFLLDFCIHCIDLISYLYGDVATVYAMSTPGRHAYSVSLRFTSGAVGSMSLADGRSFQVPTEEVEMTLEGGHFMSIHNSSTWRISRDGQPCEWREPPTFVSVGDSGLDTGHFAELLDFVEALKAGRKTARSAIYESYKSMLLYEAIRDSAATGREVVPVYAAL